MTDKKRAAEFLQVVGIGAIAQAEEFLNAGVSINGLGEETPLGTAILKNKHKMLDFLLLKGADINKPYEGKSLLSLAVKHKNLKAVDKLLARGANPNEVVVDLIALPNAPENNVVTVKSLLMIAVELKDYDVMRSLLKAGANPLLNAGRYDTAFETAMDCERCEEYFHQMKQYIKRPLTKAEEKRIEGYIIATRQRDN